MFLEHLLRVFLTYSALMLSVPYMLLLCHVQLTPWTVAHQVFCPWDLPRQEYWSELPFLPPGDLPHPGMALASPVSPASQVDSTTEPSGEL